jgi:hypothetical protein
LVLEIRYSKSVISKTYRRIFNPQNNQPPTCNKPAAKAACISKNILKGFVYSCTSFFASKTQCSTDPSAVEDDWVMLAVLSFLCKGVAS